MRKLAFVAALVVGGNLGLFARGAGLARIDCRIAREPAYQHKPKYCLLLFGPQAKTRVWLVLDGDVLYVDRNGNGNLTEKGKQVAALKPAHVFAAGNIMEPDRGSKHTGLLLKPEKDGRMVISIMTDGKCRQQTGKVTFARRPGQAPIVHFNGPLSVRFAGAVADTGLDRVASSLAQIGNKGPLKLGKEIPLPGGRRQSRAVTLSAVVGTPGSGAGTFATYKAREILGQPNERIAVRVAFPNRDSKARPIVVEGFLEPDN
jgi:hypothetical protein